MIRAGIIGGAGYTAGELIRLIINHEHTQLDFVYSTSNAGNDIQKVHRDLLGDIDMKFSKAINPNVDVIFLCLGHGNSSAFLKENEFSATTKIIDLSNDFRLTKDSVFHGKEFIYGLPELNKKEIIKAQYIANPGCFATAIQLALLPLAKASLLKDDVHVNAVTGATGAGVSLSGTTHFSWRDNNFSHYKAFDHQHLGEINENIMGLQADFDGEVIFVPNRGNFSRGIFATAYTKYDGSFEDAKNLYASFYNEAAFTFYPNPVKNTLTLNAQNIIEQVAMYNMLGQEVLRATPNTVDSDLDMSNLQTGTYFVKVTIGNVTKTIRVIKQ